MSPQRWTIQERPLALVTPGENPVVIPVKECGRGKYSVCLRGARGMMKDTVFLVTWGQAGEKDVLTKLAGQSIHLPVVSKAGRVKAGRHWFSLYQSPHYSQRLSRKNRRIARVLQRCVDELEKDSRFFAKAGTVLWSNAARPLMRAVRECAEEGRLPPGVLYALRILCRGAKGKQFFLEFQDENLAQDRDGNLILLDVLGTVNVNPPERDSRVIVQGL